jgi:hypothetical protein
MSFVIGGPSIGVFQGFLHSQPLWLGRTRDVHQGACVFGLRSQAVRCLAVLRTQAVGVLLNASVFPVRSSGHWDLQTVSDLIAGDLFHLEAPA